MAVVTLLPFLSHGQVVTGSTVDLTQAVDSVVKAQGDTVVPARTGAAGDTSRFVLERVDLDHVVEFNAKDSIILYGRNHAVMYGNGKILYGDIDMSAAQISMDMDSSQVQAIGVPDSVGELKGNPVFKDNSGEYESRVMKYNFKTKRGYITDIVTEQGEGFLTGGITKKTEDDYYYIKDGRYTTCDDHEHPHFYFQLTKAKVKPKKNVVTGPAFMVLEDLPLPIAVPFGYFPSARNTRAVSWCPPSVRITTVASTCATEAIIWRSTSMPTWHSLARFTPVAHGDSRPSHPIRGATGFRVHSV